MPMRRGRSRARLLFLVVSVAACGLATLAVSVPPAVSVTGSATGAADSAAARAALAKCPWLRQSLSIERRVKMLIGAMSLADKISMVTGQGNGQAYARVVAALPALCVPELTMQDGPDGVGDGMSGVTQLPAGVALAATWDPALAWQYGKVIGEEDRGKGIDVDLGPTVNIDRDPRWGRSFEALSEDPFLNSALAVSEIEGIQSQDVMAEVKHFAAYNQETNRNTSSDDVIVSKRVLHEIYLPAFQQAVSVAKVASVMCAYSMVNGAFSCQNPYLLQTTLDKRWGFQGFVASDSNAIHSTSAALDGADMEQPGDTYFGQPLENEITAHTVPLAVLNEMVRRILTEMFRFGFFNHRRTGSPYAVVTSAAHRRLSAEVAVDGTVLLKNYGGILPLRARGGGTIAVIGTYADQPVDSGGGSAKVVAPYSTSPLSGLQGAAGRGTRVTYSQGLPTPADLSAVPATALSPGYVAADAAGGGYTGTLTAPETGTYVLAAGNSCRCERDARVTLDGAKVIDVPGGQGAGTYSVAVGLTAGHRYNLSVSGPVSGLTWATPSAVSAFIDAAVKKARAARTAIVVVADNTESEGSDRTTLDLPGAQNQLVSAVAAANRHTVVVIDAGAPVVMPWLRKVAAVVDAWYPGESNGWALAQVLYGHADPSGHLPVTFPVRLSQVPAASPARFPGVNGKVMYSEGLLVGYRWYDAKNITPLFPFGFGLSYTRFHFSDLSVTPSDVVNRRSGPRATRCQCNGQSAGLVAVSLTLTNTGPVAGADVVQLYLGDPARVGEPPRQLKAFRRVMLRPGQSATVRFILTGHDLSYWNDARNGWVVPTGRFRVYVGDSSALRNLPLRGGFSVVASIG
jgi:beta-glucosidase